MRKESEELKALIQKLEKKVEPVKIATKNLESVRVLMESIKIPNVTRELGLGQSLKTFAELNERLPLISKAFVQKGIIKNHEALTSVLNSVHIPNWSFMTQLKMVDSVISLRKILGENTEILRSICIPHMPFYRHILDSIDEDSYEQIQKIMEAQSFDRQEGDADAVEDDLGEGIKIVRPNFFNAAIKINVYMTVTDNHIHINANVSEEEKNLWNKVIVPVLMFLQQIFITWAMGDTPITEMQIVKQFEKVVKVIEDYQYPIETTDIKIETKKEEL